MTQLQILPIFIDKFILSATMHYTSMEKKNSRAVIMSALIYIKRSYGKTLIKQIVHRYEHSRKLVATKSAFMLAPFSFLIKAFHFCIVYESLLFNKELESLTSLISLLL